MVTLDSGVDVGPTFISLEFFSMPYGLIKGPTFIKFWNFFHRLQIFSSFFGFFQHKFAHFVPGHKFIQGPMIIVFDKVSRPYVYPESRVER